MRREGGWEVLLQVKHVENGEDWISKINREKTFKAVLQVQYFHCVGESFKKEEFSARPGCSNTIGVGARSWK